jgi:hypothetical protein
MSSLNSLPHLSPAYPGPGTALGLNNDQPQNERANQIDTGIGATDQSELDDTPSLTDQPAINSPHEHLSLSRSDVDAANVPPIMNGNTDATQDEKGNVVSHGGPTQQPTPDPYDADDEGEDSDEEADDEDYGPVPPRVNRVNPASTRPERSWAELAQMILNTPLPVGLRNLSLSDEDSATSSSIATLRAWFDLPSSTESESDSDMDEDDDEDEEDEEEDDNLTHFTDGSGYDERSGSGSSEDEDDGELAAIIALVDSELDSLLPEEFDELMGLDTDHDVGADSDGREGEGEDSVWDELGQGEDGTDPDEDEDSSLGQEVVLTVNVRSRTARRWGGDGEEDINWLALVPLSQR